MVEIMTPTENAESVSDVNTISLVNYTFMLPQIRGPEQSTTTLPAVWLLLNTFLRNISLALEPDVINLHYFFTLRNWLNKEQKLVVVSFWDYMIILIFSFVFRWLYQYKSKLEKSLNSALLWKRVKAVSLHSHWSTRHSFTELK